MKMNNIDLDVLVKENHDAMKNGSYNWQDNEVRAVYALIYHFLKTVQCPQKEMEDMVRLFTLYPDYLLDVITPHNSYFKLF